MSEQDSKTSASRFSHLDKEGQARMVDVSAKKITRRIARAACRVLLDADTVERLHRLPKGDAHVVARIAGIQGAKRVDEIIPLCHTLPLEHVDVIIEPLDGDASGVEIRSEVVVTAKTGAEMEALTACSHAALALYDMVKAVDRGAVITDLRLLAKSGGRSGDWARGDWERERT